MMTFALMEVLMSRPATKADLDEALARQLRRLTWSFGLMMTIAGLILWALL
jgi:hypothetical protein